MDTFFSLVNIDFELIPAKEEGRGLKGGWDLSFPNLEESFEVISINGKQVLSVGVHGMHSFMLLSKKHTLNQPEAETICNYLSYVFDYPILPNFPMTAENERSLKKHLIGMRPLYKLRGLNKNYRWENYLQDQASAVESIQSVIGDNYQRAVPGTALHGLRKKMLALNFPENSDLARAVFVYKQALLSIEPSGQLLNYWRALEAVTKDKSERLIILESLPTAKLKTVLAKKFGSGARGKTFCLAKLNLSVAKKRYTDLLTKFDNSAKVLNYFYFELRNPSAHADINSLNTNQDLTLSDLQKDIVVIKCLARLAIEKKWRNFD